MGGKRKAGEIPQGFKPCGFCACDGERVGGEDGLRDASKNITTQEDLSNVERHWETHHVGCWFNRQINGLHQRDSASVCLGSTQSVHFSQHYAGLGGPKCTL